MNKLRSAILDSLQTSKYLAARVGVAVASVPSLRVSRNTAQSLAGVYARLQPRHMERARRNVAAAFPEYSPEQVDDVALRSIKHFFMFGAEFAYVQRMLTEDGWARHITPGPLGPGLRSLIKSGPAVLITGHVGNWEILGYTIALLGFPMHAVYRPLDVPALDRWVRGTRSRRGLELVDKFGVVRRLPVLAAAGAPLGLVADQNGGDRGVFVPYFNRLTSTYKSIGLLAMQIGARVVCGFARRRPISETRDPDLLGYSLEVTDDFGPEDWATHPDPLFYLTARYRRAIEKMIRLAPEQYLWMHRIWRSRPRHERLQKPFPASLLEKIRLLPWTTDEDLERIKDHSIRDARTLLETGHSRLS